MKRLRIWKEWMLNNMTTIKEFIRDSIDGLSHVIDMAMMDGVFPSDKAIIKYAILDDEYYSSLSKEYVKVQVIQYGKNTVNAFLLDTLQKFFQKVTIYQKVQSWLVLKNCFSFIDKVIYLR